MSFVDAFTGQPVQPSDVSYGALTLSADTTLVWPLEASSSATLAPLILQVTPTTAGLALTLPMATLVSPGQAIIIRNMSGSATSFALNSSGGANILTVSAGFAYYVYLTDNSTAAGVWGTLVFGGSAAPASAAALAGAGLTVISSMLASNLPLTAQSSSFILSVSSRATGHIYTGGAGTCTLPAAATATNGYWFAVANQGSGTLTIDPDGGELIDGAASLDLAIGEEAIVGCGGASWWTLSRSRSLSATITRLSLSVTGGTRLLTATEAQNALIYVSGILASNQNIDLPASSGRWFIANNTTGAFTLTIRVTGGVDPGTTVPQAEQRIVMSNGTNMIAAMTTTPIAPTSYGAGLVGSPSIFLVATNTGQYFPTASSVAWATGGTEFFRASAAGLLVNSVTLTDASNNVPWARLTANVLPQVQAYALGL